MVDGWTDVNRRGYVGIRLRSFCSNQGGTANACIALDQCFYWSRAFSYGFSRFMEESDMERKKIVILGAGHVGSHCAYALASAGFCEEIVLVDMCRNKAQAQSLDIADSTSFFARPVTVRAGVHEECAEASLVVVAIGEPRMPGQTRLDLLGRSVELLLQTKLRVEPILSGILVSTGLYTVNYAILGGQSNLYLQSQVQNASGVMVNASSKTVFRLFGALPVCGQGLLKEANAHVLVLTLGVVIVLIVTLGVFFFTRPGMAIRATGDNEEMVRSSSINADLTRTAGVMLANALVALSGALICQQQRYADLGCGNGMLVMGLASVIIGQALTGRHGVVCGLFSAAGGSLIYRVVLQLAYKVNMPSYAVKLLSALIVVLALSMPILQKKLALLRKGGDRA